MNNFSLTVLLGEDTEQAYCDKQGATGRTRRAGRIPPRPKPAKRLWLPAFRGRAARPVAVSEGIPLGTAKTRIRHRLRTPRARITDPNTTAPTHQPRSRTSPGKPNRHDNHRHHGPGLRLVSIGLARTLPRKGNLMTTATKLTGVDLGEMRRYAAPNRVMQPQRPRPPRPR